MFLGFYFWNIHNTEDDTLKDSRRQGNKKSIELHKNIIKAGKTEQSQFLSDF